MTLLCRIQDGMGERHSVDNAVHAEFPANIPSEPGRPVSDCCAVARVLNERPTASGWVISHDLGKI